MSWYVDGIGPDANPALDDRLLYLIHGCLTPHSTIRRVPHASTLSLLLSLDETTDISFLNVVLVRRPDSLGIYVHFPYCLQKCHYCDFFSVPLQGELPVQAFLHSIEQEWDIRVSHFSRFSTVDSVFFGGGTASLLPAKALKQMLDLFRTAFTLSADCEITLEGNPENLTPQYLEELLHIGINRINAGIQTFSGKYLNAMNRFFDKERYQNILHNLSLFPFRSRGVDLIYGFPGQTFEEFLSDLDRITEVQLEHLSVYSLTEEAGTPYATRIRDGLMKAPDEELQEQIFTLLPELLAEKGYTMYEVSNYARPGYECRHNMRYWLYQPYMGLGPGAHGFDGTFRYGNPRNIDRWQANPGQAARSPHNVDIDVPLNLFRLAIPFRPSWMKDLLEENQSSRAADVFPFFQEQEELGHGSFLEDDLFRWTEKGRLQLDGIIERWVIGQKAK